MFKQLICQAVMALSLHVRPLCLGQDRVCVCVGWGGALRGTIQVTFFWLHPKTTARRWVQRTKACMAHLTQLFLQPFPQPPGSVPSPPISTPHHVDKRPRTKIPQMWVQSGKVRE